MPQQYQTSIDTQGDRALRQRSSHDDHEPGLEIVNWGSIISGAAIMAYGLLRRRRMTDILYYGAGAGLIYRGAKKSDLVNRSVKRLTLHTGATQPVEISTSMTVECPVDEVYSFWRRLPNLPRFLRHIDSIEAIDDRHSRWTATLPGGLTLTWRAEILEDRENELLAWQSVEGSDLFNEGFVTFRPVFDGQGTEIHARIVYHPPAGAMGKKVANFFDNIQSLVVREDLRSFKQLIETGELATTDGQPSARRHRGNGRLERLMH